MIMHRVAVASTLLGAALFTAGFAPAEPNGEAGDRIECASFLGGETRGGEILAVRGDAGEKSYLVRWDDGKKTIRRGTDDCIVLPAEESGEPAGAATETSG